MSEFGSATYGSYTYGDGTEMALPTTGIVIPNLFANGSNINWDTDTWKVALYNSTWSPDVGSTLGYSSGNEVTGTGYTAGGQALTNVTITRTGGQFLMTADNVVWTSSTLSDVAAVAIYSDTATSPVSKPVVGVIKLAAAGANSNGNFTIRWGITPTVGTVIHVPGAS